MAQPSEVITYHRHGEQPRPSSSARVDFTDVAPVGGKANPVGLMPLENNSYNPNPHP
ncbi:MAG: hypothetical protein H6862_03560 [Rhodospirillales bacterium]|nr:hypothetical protein [Rhodospirillales bacterium]